MKKIYLLAFAAILFSSANAQTAVFDASFGNNGIAVLPYDLDFADLTILPDGKIIAAGGNSVLPSGFRIARFDTVGHLDASFGTGGITAVPTSAGPYTRTVAVQSDGKILVAGDVFMAGPGGSGVMRLNANGSVDSSFGNNGFVEIISSSTAVLTRAIVKPNGKILLYGTNNNSPFVIMQQLDSTGAFDTTFGNGGFSYCLVQTFGSSTVSNTSVALQPDGKMVVGAWVGYAWQGNSGISLTRILPNGFTDSTFGFGGIALYIQQFMKCKPLALTLQPDGKIVVGAIGSYDTASGSQTYVSVVRFNADGSTDNAYGNNGQADAKVTVALNNECWKWDMTVQADGKALIAGGQYISPGFSKGMIARFNTNGTLDSAFGSRGILATDLPFNAWQAIALQPDGKIVVGGPGMLARFESNARTRYNYLTFDAFLDRNFDGIRDFTEPSLAANATVTYNTGDTIHVYSSTGEFDVEVDTGSYSTSVIPSLPYFNVVPAAHSTALANYFNNEYFSFALQPIAGIKDVSIVVVPLIALRPGWQAEYKIVCANKGTDTLSGTYRFIKDSRLIYQSAYPAPLSVNGDTLTWSYNNLPSFVTTEVVVNLQVKQPPFVNVGDTLHCSANASAFAGETNLANNTASIIQTVRGSYDPNDKAENHAGTIKLSDIVAGDYLTYTIRFQNTGNDTAFNVYIHDTLNTNLDWSTMQMLTSSANYQMTLNDGKCVWSFNNINLVDSIKNEPLSHGYIVYRIKPKANVQVGNIITNRAAIFFDYNLPVITNTENTTVVADVLPLKLLTFTAKKEGKTNHLQWSTSNEVNVDRFEVERSNDAREYVRMQNVKCKMQNGSSYDFIDHSPLTTHNYYRLKMVDKDGRFEYSPVRVISNNSSFYVSAHPNPVKDILQVEIVSDKKAALQMQIISQDGKVLMSELWNPPSGGRGAALNVSALQSGSYFLRVTSLNPPSGGRGAAVVKFAKL